VISLKYFLNKILNENFLFRENIECVDQNIRLSMSNNIIEMHKEEHNRSASHAYSTIVDTPKAKRLCYPGDILYLEASTPRSVLKYVNLLKKNIEKKNVLIKKLSSKSTRQIKRIRKLKDLISNLRNKNYISEGAENILKV